MRTIKKNKFINIKMPSTDEWRPLAPHDRNISKLNPILLQSRDMAVSTCENMSGKPEKNTKEGRKAYAMAHELKLIKAIAGNNKTVREKALKKLDKWLQFRMKQIPLTEADAMRLWKGLFYAIWTADKPLVQEEQCDRVSALVHLGNPQLSVLFFKCGLKTLGNEWFGIDQLRLDKFLMFVRRLLRNGFIVLRDNNWNVKTIRAFNDALTETVLNVTQPPPVGLTMHFTEIYLEELAKVSRGKVSPHLITEFLRPFVKQLSLLKDTRQMSCVKRCLFKYLLEQSDSGIEYQAKFRAWSAEGFPGGSIDAMQRVPVAEEDSDEEQESDGRSEEESSGVLDPRAGHVDVLLPQLKFACKEIVALLKEYRFAEGSNTKCRKTIASIIEWYSKMSKGEYPLGMKKLQLPKKDGYSTKTKNAVNRLVKFERKLGVGSKKRKLNQTEFDIQTDPDNQTQELDDQSPENPATEDAPKRKKRRKSTIIDDNILQQDLLEKQSLLNGINSELTRKKKELTPPEEGYEFTFKRNSGRWFVYNCGDESMSITDDSFQKSPGKEPGKKKTPDKGIPQKNTLFMQDDWDSDVPTLSKFVPDVPKLVPDLPKVRSTSPKKKSKRDSLTRENPAKMEVSGRKTAVLTSTPVRNPFSTPGGSAKKVKIDLKMNCSQEVHEHVRKVRNSPGIPFDATRRPAKPLLKSRMSTPIDPFYKKH